ncbi:DUF3048 domain-containing protein [Streptomyces sp. NBC_01803]|uniref:DUF3048 domain-containing protein n=1 Tax=Streptomyces sp. NBC_01803 TaxID=2975946 RepID=UPI002DDC6471|nr:DUF3048 domain-containing protein [Streptomyces sp. NBC_01803]WSA45583.1 DUF3048 domain-containing protein [Streptomyces sp. NBC_01803]
MAGNIRTFAVVLALGALVTGCGNDGDNGDRGGGSADRADVSPFTGEEAESGPVLAVKIDNSPDARPHTGLDQADIVYVEQVEGGSSRLMAVFSSHLPDLTGPVRSARESDLELLRQFGEPALAYSGVQTKLKPLIADAPLFAESPDAVPDAYVRDDAREAPYNLYVKPQQVLDAAPDASEASDIGFRFGDAPGGGEPTERYDVSFPAAGFSFTWSADEKRWMVAMDGTATDVGAATVVVQEVTIRQSQYHDVLGNFTPYTETVGSGDATVLRDGQAFPAEWERSGEEDGTEFTTPDGDPMRFAPGPVWVVLAEKSG